MKSSSEEKDGYLLSPRSSSEERVGLADERPIQHKRQRRRFSVSWILVGLLVVTNLTTVGLLLRSTSGGSSHEEFNYFGESTSQPPMMLPVHDFSEWIGSNRTLSDELWSQYHSPSSGLVTVPASWARKQGLPKSMQDVNNSSNVVYFVAAFHQLHCLSIVREALYQFKEERQQTSPWIHTLHCLDTARQGLVVGRDETLLYTEDGINYGDGQVHETRPLDTLRDWMLARHYEDLIHQ